eukprot:6176332-Pleurochrysis_carterae.AAC.4
MNSFRKAYTGAHAVRGLSCMRASMRTSKLAAAQTKSLRVPGVARQELITCLNVVYVVKIMYEYCMQLCDMPWDACGCLE